MQVFRTKAELLALDKARLVDIIIQLHNTLQIPEVAINLNDQAVKNKRKKLACCQPFPCCLKVD